MKRLGQDIAKHLGELHERKTCMAPPSIKHECSSLFVRSHIISRSVGLERISKDGKILSLNNSPYGVVFTGANKLDTNHISSAMRLNIFCAHHDDQIFAPIEKYVFQPTPEKIAIISFRTAASTLHLKRLAIESTAYQKKLILKNSLSTINKSSEAQKYFADDLANSLERAQFTYEMLSRAILNKNADDLSYLVFQTKRPFPIAISASFNINQSGLFALRNENTERFPIAQLLINTLTNENGSYIVFSWVQEHQKVKLALEPLSMQCAQFAKEILWRTFFSFLFHTTPAFFCFSPEWFLSLNDPTQKFLKSLVEKRPVQPYPEIFSSPSSKVDLNIEIPTLIQSHFVS